jgi:beta-ketodecanoyl-[acyl-carrier-protein] synthase
MSVDVVISGVGLWKPPFRISNDELVASYNGWAERYNREHGDRIARGEIEPKPLSSAEFIEKASGIRSRYAYEKAGILDLARMRPCIRRRGEDELSHQAEIALNSARPALAAAGRLNADGTAAGIDMVIVACAYTERSYPAIAIEVQHALGIRGVGFDMLVACSAATFALQRAVDAIMAGSAAAVLVINPELTSPQVDYTDRDSHFIFGDVSTATVLERADNARGEHRYRVLGRKAQTLYSNNIRSNFGYVARAEDTDPFGPANLFHQNGRKVFKEVCPMAAEHLERQIAELSLSTGDIRRWWLHQANLNMNQLIIRRLLGRDASQQEAPIVLDEFANTASAGSIVAFCLHHEDLQPGDHGVICSFGAGYSIGSLVVRKV